MGRVQLLLPHRIQVNIICYRWKAFQIMPPLASYITECIIEADGDVGWMRLNNEECQIEANMD